MQAAFAAGHILRQFDEVHFHEGLAENHPAGRFLEAEHRLHLIVFGKLSKLRDGIRKFPICWHVPFPEGKLRSC